MDTKIIPGPGCREVVRSACGHLRTRILRTISQNPDDPLRSWSWVQEKRLSGWQTIMTFAPNLPPKEE